MEVINVSGYVGEEKKMIALKYLAPAACTAAGLDEKKVILADDAIEGLIKFYCRESGVRNLKKHIEKVYRKAALKIVQDESLESITVTMANLKEFVGSPPFSKNAWFISFSF